MRRSTPRSGSGSGKLAVELEGLGVVAQGLVRGQGSEGRFGRPPGVVEGLGQVDRLGGAEPVVGEIAHACPGALPAHGLQGLGHGAMSPRPARDPQVLVHGVLDEGVGEAVAPGNVDQLTHQAAAAAASRTSRSSPSELLGHPGQQLQVEVPSDHRRQGRGPGWRRLAQPGHSGADDFSHAVGQGQGWPSDAAPPSSARCHPG